MAKAPVTAIKALLRSLFGSIVGACRGLFSLKALRKNAVKFRAAIQRKPPNQEWVRQAKTLVETGRRHFNAHRYEKAEEAFREAINADPHNPWAPAYLGHTLYHLARLDEAMLYWERAIKISPKSKAAALASEKLEVVKNKQRRAADEFYDYVTRR